MVGYLGLAGTLRVRSEEAAPARRVGEEPGATRAEGEALLAPGETSAYQPPWRALGTPPRTLLSLSLP